MNSFYDQIEDYLTNRLSDSDKALFESELAKDGDLSAEVEFRRNLAFALKNKELFDFDSIVQEVIKTTPLPNVGDTSGGNQPPEVSFWTKGWIWGLATSILLIIGIGGYTVYQYFGNTQNQDLVLTYLEPLENTLNLDLTSDKSLVSGMRSYEVGMYEQAINHLSNAGKDDIVQLYLAISYQMSGDFEASLVILNEIEKEVDEVLLPSILWYKGLALYYRGRTEEANLVFTQLREDPDYGDQVGQFLNN